MSMSTTMTRSDDKSILASRATPQVDARAAISRGTGYPNVLSAPDGPGLWRWSPTLESGTSVVEVVETNAGGRLCRQLKMGGSSQCPGYRDWAGFWRRGN